MENTGHDSHVAFPTLLWNVPLLHVIQRGRPEVLATLPAGQLVHDVAPLEFENEPTY